MPKPLIRLSSDCSLPLRRVTRVTSRNLAGPATHLDRPFCLNLQCVSTAQQPRSFINVPYSGSGIAAFRWANHPSRSGPVALRGGSDTASSSKLVRDDPYPYIPRLFIRSRKVDEEPDASEYDPELVLDLDDTSE